MERVNLHDPRLGFDDTDRDGYHARMDRFGGSVYGRR
jgi:hypothetical protein